LAEVLVFVMAGLRPGHPRLGRMRKKDVDARHKAGHDGTGRISASYEIST
jgi:hypothetical protein